MASVDRSAGFAAVSASSAELALLKPRHPPLLAQLLRQGSARAYAERHEMLDVDVRAHLELAPVALAEVSPIRKARQSQAVQTSRRSSP